MNPVAASGVDLGLQGKHVIVLGVADETSIAWGITEAFLNCGAHVRIGFQQRFFSRVRLLCQKHRDLQAQRCDVENETELRDFFESLGERPIDVLVHSIAYGPPEIFTKPPSEVSTEAITQAMRISAHSLPLVVRQAKGRLAEWSSVVALSFQAALRAWPLYGMMGVAKSALEGMVRYVALELGERKVRVNAISPGPVETLAALGIIIAFSRDPAALEQLRGRILHDSMESVTRERPGLRESDELAWARLVWGRVQQALAEHCPLPELITKEDIANCALFLGSDLSRKITGQVIQLDCGLSSTLIL